LWKEFEDLGVFNVKILCNDQGGFVHEDREVDTL
jgi:hypothetical protein